MSTAASVTAEPTVRLAERRIVDMGLVAIGLAYALGALVGLPLFEDGGWYYFKIVTDAEPLVPNLRYAAVIPQVPALLAARLDASATAVRHAFALGYAALPLLSLAASWLLVRRPMPPIVLLPLLAFLLNLINFSSVSELLSSLYLTWPLVLAMAFRAERPCVWLYAAAAGPLLSLLHPMTFIPAFGLALLALAVAWVRPEVRRIWLWLGGLFVITGVWRLIWTLSGTGAYERQNLTPDGAAHYVLTETPGQHLLLAAVVILGSAVGWSLFRAGRGSRRPAGAVPRWLIRGLAILPAIAVLVSAELMAGEGIKLKAASTFGVALLLMAAASLIGLRPRSSRSGHLLCRGYALPAAPIVISMLLILLTKSAAWWTATQGLRQVIGEAEVDCIPLEWHAPFGLQWPWMGLIDDWATPMNALAFRPELPLRDGSGIAPIPLLLPGEGCRLLREAGVVYPTPWMHRPFEVLEERFGPLRQPGG